MSIETIMLIRHLSVVVSVLFALLCCLGVPGWRSSPYRWVLPPLAVGALLETAGTWTSQLGITNTVLYNLYLPFEFMMLLLLIQLLHPEWRTRLRVALVLGLAAWATSWWMNEPMAFLLTDAIMVLALLLTITLLGTLWRLADTSDQPLQREPLFWLLIGLLTYFGGLFPIIGPLKFIEQTSPLLSFNLYLIINLLAVLRYLLTGVACLLERRSVLLSTHP
ncbi:MAG TPA: hypothetical protein PLN54_14610 [Flavobacteriales bacterium]|nr:hypothetical protein [Flavobacteriales bacterium]